MGKPKPPTYGPPKAQGGYWYRDRDPAQYQSGFWRLQEVIYSEVLHGLAVREPNGRHTAVAKLDRDWFGPLLKPPHDIKFNG